MIYDYDEGHGSWRFQCQPWNYIPVMISLSAGTQFSSKISNSDVSHRRWRFQRQPWNWDPVMICASVGTQFSSMISDSDVGRRSWRFQRQPWNWVYGDDFWFARDSDFINDFWFWCRPWRWTIQGQPWNWVPVTISNSEGTQISSFISDSDVSHGSWRFQR